MIPGLFVSTLGNLIGKAVLYGGEVTLGGIANPEDLYHHHHLHTVEQEVIRAKAAMASCFSSVDITALREKRVKQI